MVETDLKSKLVYSGAGDAFLGNSRGYVESCLLGCRKPRGYAGGAIVKHSNNNKGKRLSMASCDM